MARALQDYVTRQAERRPDASALVDGDLRVTYEALETRANRLARLLRERVRRGDRIGLLLPKSPAAIAAMLASLKLGAIYVPLDPESPAARLEKILRAAECAVLLASAPAVPGAGGRLGAHAKSPLPEERYRAHRGAFWVEASSIPRCCVPARARWKAAAAAG